MKSLILVSALLVGFSVSAQVCKVSEDTVERIESMKDSSMMAKPKYTTIRALVASDACAAKYLTDGDSATLAREIMALKFIPAEQILNYFVEQADAKLRLNASQACKASAETLSRIQELRDSSMMVKIRYVTMKGVLAEDECLSSELNQAQVYELAQELIFGAADDVTSEYIIDAALNAK